MAQYCHDAAARTLCVTVVITILVSISISIIDVDILDSIIGSSTNSL